MTFTKEEENILKLIARDLKGKVKLAKANNIMGDEIRAAFSTIDAAKRLLHKDTITPLQAEVVSTKTAIEELIE